MEYIMEYIKYDILLDVMRSALVGYSSLEE